jgi:hypothetical protein
MSGLRCPQGCGKGVGLSNEWGQATAFEQLVAAMLDARHDYATTAFDEALAQAEADGGLDPATARLLRWWQRETVRAVVDHAARVLPPAVLALQDAERAAVAEADHAMATIRAQAPEPLAAAAVPAEPPAEAPVTDRSPLTVVLPDTDAAAGLPPVAPDSTPPTAVTPIGRVELRPWPGEPPVVPPTADAATPDLGAPDLEPAEGARRTLVAGLRVLPDPTAPPPPT